MIKNGSNLVFFELQYDKMGREAIHAYVNKYISFEG